MTKDEIYLGAFTAAMAAIAGAMAKQLMRTPYEQLETQAANITFVAAAIADQVLQEKGVLDAIVLEDAKETGKHNAT